MKTNQPLMTATERMRRWRKANPERHRENMKRWRKANMDKIRGYRRKCYQKNADHYRTWRLEYRRRNSAAHIAYDKRKVQHCDDRYMVQLLRSQGVLSPTGEQIQRKRVQILALRTQRIFKLMTYARLGK